MPPVTASLILDRTAVPLSEPVRATVTVEGPAPLVVAAPPDLLAGASAEAAGVLPAAAAALVRGKGKPPPPTPAEWAGRELAKLERELAAGSVAPATAADRLAEVVRVFVERRYGAPATRLTTAELAAAD